MVCLQAGTLSEGTHMVGMDHEHFEAAQALLTAILVAGELREKARGAASSRQSLATRASG